MDWMGLDWMGYPILLWHQEHRSRAMLIMNADDSRQIADSRHHAQRRAIFQPMLGRSESIYTPKAQHQIEEILPKKRWLCVVDIVHKKRQSANQCWVNRNQSTNTQLDTRSYPNDPNEGMTWRQRRRALMTLCLCQHALLKGPRI